MHADLLAWFQQNRRLLPWRQQRHAYGVWISEVMLQQTQVDTVIPFYHRWMERFPDVASLVAATEEDVLKYWSGLGYYRRARFLHQGARYIFNECAGSFPTSAEQWLKVPGVGPYTAAAVASITLDERIAVVDGNVKRVAARLLGIKLALNDRALHTKAESWSQELLASTSHDDFRAGDWNEGLMELGATVCRPRQPLCTTCPVQNSCKAQQSGADPNEFPLAAKRKKFVALELDYVWSADEKQCVLIQRQQGWNVGLYEAPTREQWAGEIGEKIGSLKHTITHHKITAHFYKAVGDSPLPQTDPTSVPLSGLMRKWLKLVQNL